MKTTAICILCMIAVCGCALQQDVVALGDRIYTLEKRSMEIQQRNTTLERENAQLKSRVEDVGKMRDESREQSAGLEAKFDRIRDDIQKLNGRVEEIEHITKDGSGKNLVDRVERLEQAANIRAGAEPPRLPEKPDSPLQQPPTRRDVSENELYESARQAFERDDMETARQGFKELIQKFPKSANADSAQFWIGETYFREKQYERAIAEYQTTIEKYPRGKKVSGALLKQGLSFLYLGDKANARTILKELVSKYPDSNEAKIAAQKLKGL